MPVEFTQEVIEQYLNKQLKGTTLTAFEAKMSSDADFKKEVSTQAFLHRGVNKFGEDEMRSKLKKIRAEVLKEKVGKTQDTKTKVVSLGQKKKSRPILRWSMAAAIALALGAAIYLVSTHQNVSALDLYASYYQPYSEEINVRSASAGNLATEASQFYKDKKYGVALPLFVKVLEAEPDNAEVQLALGICQLELDRFENANQTFSAVSNPLYRDQAQWYLAMNFLKQSDTDNAKTILESIQQGDFNYAKAQEILSAF